MRLDKDFLKALQALQRAGRGDVARRVHGALEGLREDPFRPRSGLDIRHLEGMGPDVFRLRVGEYRVIYEADRRERIVYVTLLTKRGGAYK